MEHPAHSSMPCPPAVPQRYCTPKPLGQLSVLESRGSFSKFALSLGDFGGRQVGAGFGTKHG